MTDKYKYKLPVTCGRCGASLALHIAHIALGRQVGDVNEFYDHDDNLVHRCGASTDRDAG